MVAGWHANCVSEERSRFDTGLVGQPNRANGCGPSNQSGRRCRRFRLGSGRNGSHCQHKACNSPRRRGNRQRRQTRLSLRRAVCAAGSRPTDTDRPCRSDLYMGFASGRVIATCNRNGAGAYCPAATGSDTGQRTKCSIRRGRIFGLARSRVPRASPQPDAAGSGRSGRQPKSLPCHAMRRHPRTVLVGLGARPFPRPAYWMGRQPDGIVALGSPRCCASPSPDFR